MITKAATLTMQDSWEQYQQHAVGDHHHQHRRLRVQEENFSLRQFMERSTSAPPLEPFDVAGGVGSGGRRLLFESKSIIQSDEHDSNNNYDEFGVTTAATTRDYHGRDYFTSSGSFQQHSGASSYLFRSDGTNGRATVPALHNSNREGVTTTMRDHNDFVNVETTTSTGMHRSHSAGLVNDKTATLSTRFAPSLIDIGPPPGMKRPESSPPGTVNNVSAVDNDGGGTGKKSGPPPGLNINDYGDGATVSGNSAFLIMTDVMQIGQNRPASTGIIGKAQCLPSPASSSSITTSLGLMTLSSTTNNNDVSSSSPDGKVAVRPSPKTLMDLIQEDFPKSKPPAYDLSSSRTPPSSRQNIRLSVAGDASVAAAANVRYSPSSQQYSHRDANISDHHQSHEQQHCQHQQHQSSPQEQQQQLQQQTVVVDRYRDGSSGASGDDRQQWQDARCISQRLQTSTYPYEQDVRYISEQQQQQQNLNQHHQVPAQSHMYTTHAPNGTTLQQQQQLSLSRQYEQQHHQTQYEPLQLQQQQQQQQHVNVYYDNHGVPVATNSASPLGGRGVGTVAAGGPPHPPMHQTAQMLPSGHTVYVTSQPSPYGGYSTIQYQNVSTTQHQHSHAHVIHHHPSSPHLQSMPAPISTIPHSPLHPHLHHQVLQHHHQPYEQHQQRQQYISIIPIQKQHGVVAVDSTSSGGDAAPTQVTLLPPSSGMYHYHHAGVASSAHRDIGQLPPMTTTTPSTLCGGNGGGGGVRSSKVVPMNTLLSRVGGSDSSPRSKGATVNSIRGQQKSNRRGGGGGGCCSSSSMIPGTPLLDEFRSTYSNSNNDNIGWTVMDIKGHLVEFCQDQNGSRLIQQRLEVGSDVEKQIVSDEVIPSVRVLRNDVFGNYVVQKLFEHGTPETKCMLRDTLKGELLPLSLQMYGCRVVQKALEQLDEDDLPSLLVEFHHNVISCIHDQNGNHVIQKCIEVMCKKSKLARQQQQNSNSIFEGNNNDHNSEYFVQQIDFIIDDVLNNVTTLSCHPYGCRVLQRILEHCDGARKENTLDTISCCHRVLLDDQYGNYVIQHVLQFGRSSDRDSMLDIIFQNGLLTLSKQKFASNVVEKLLKYGNANQRNRIVREMLRRVGGVSENRHQNHVLEGGGGPGPSVVLCMVQDAYANYVVQTTLDVVADGEEKRLLLEELNSHSSELPKYAFAKHIVAKLSTMLDV